MGVNLVSVCMATYNGAKYVREQTLSILLQLGRDDELIVSDDCSTDGTREILSSIGDQRVRIAEHTPLVGDRSDPGIKFRRVSNNFENALRLARGDYIFLADQDDIWESDRVRLMVESLQNRELVMCNFCIVDQEGNGDQSAPYYGSSPISRSLTMNIIRSRFLGCCMAFRRQLLERALPFPENLLAHDLWLGCLGARKGQAVFLQQVLHRYRRYHGNVSTSGSDSQNPLWFRFVYRIEMLLLVLVRNHSTAELGNK